MIDGKDKIEIALHASMVARDALDMLQTPNKTVAKMSLDRIIDRVMDLKAAISKLPDD